MKEMMMARMKMKMIKMYLSIAMCWERNMPNTSDTFKGSPMKKINQ
jgi:hypothetical protein